MMKKILTITVLAVAVSVFFSCNGDTPEPEAPEITVFFQADPDALTFGCDDKDAQSVYISALNTTWSANVEASAQDWLKIIEESDRIDVRVEENTSDESRTGKITITPDDETLKPVEVTVTQSLLQALRITATKGISRFRGDSYKCGLSNYIFTMGAGDARYDEVSHQIIVENGYAVLFDVLTEEYSFENFSTAINPQPGVYKISMDPNYERFEFEKWSFLRTLRTEEIGKTSYSRTRLIYFDENSYTTYGDNVVLTGGRMTVDKQGENYSVTADLVSDHGQRILIDYLGPFDYTYSTAFYSTYTADREITGLTKGQLIFWEQDLNYPGIYLWGITLESPERENGATIDFWLFSPMTDPMVLDDGEYIVKDAETRYYEFTVVYGYSDGGFWVKEYDRDGNVSNSSPIIGGTVTVKYNGGRNYSIQIDAVMDNNFKLTASYEGNLEYVDKSNINSFSSGIPTGNMPDRDDRRDLNRPEKQTESE